MTKKEFIKIILNAMKEIPLEKRSKFLYKVKNDWIEPVEKILDKELEKYCLCKKCKKYFPIKNAEKVIKQETRKGILIQSDCGYGDDDIIGDADYAATYLICSHCKTENKIDEYMIKSYNHSRRRW